MKIEGKYFPGGVLNPLNFQENIEREGSKREKRERGHRFPFLRLRYLVVDVVEEKYLFSFQRSRCE